MNRARLPPGASRVPSGNVEGGASRHVNPPQEATIVRWPAHLHRTVEVSPKARRSIYQTSKETHVPHMRKLSENSSLRLENL